MGRADNFPGRLAAVAPGLREQDPQDSGELTNLPGMRDCQTGALSGAYPVAMAEKKRIRLKVAAPCKASWENMKGDDAVRHCGLCDKNVYHLSNMTSEAVEALLASSGDQKCVRFFQRKDGSVMTSDCGVGSKTRRRKQALAGIGAGALSAIGLAFAGAAPAQHPEYLGATTAEPSHATERRVAPRETPRQEGPDEEIEDIEEIKGEPVRPMMGLPEMHDDFDDL